MPLCIVQADTDSKWSMKKICEATSMSLRRNRRARTLLAQSMGV